MIIIKIGGGESINLEGIIEDIAGIKEKVIIVHGANALRDQLSERLGIRKTVITSVSGYSSVFSDNEAIDVMLMAYSGLRNKRLVELCQRHGLNAVGLTGLDGAMVRGSRNKGIRIKDGLKQRIIRDNSGKPKSINTEMLNYLLNNGYIPLLTVPILDENGFAVNSENDDIVAVLQQAVKADHIIQLIEAPGLLKKSGDENSVIDKLSPADLNRLEENVEGRIKRKIYALRKLFENGARKVSIGDGRLDHPVKSILAGKGTVIS